MSVILIVDDHEQSRYLLRTLLTASGYDVLEAANGAEALELARRTRPDLIISDILMPQMDGFALCRECKRDEALHDVPFVFYTATYTDPRDEALALRLGAARFIIKPTENSDFIAILRQVLQAHEAGQLPAAELVPEEETVFYRLYNEALIRKLEDKMLDLEQTNRRLAESEARFRRLAENAQDLIYRYEFTPQRGFTYVNPAATTITGYTPEEHYADPNLGLKIVHPDDRSLLEAYFQGGGTFREPVVLRWVRKDGQVIWTEQQNIPVFDETGNLSAIEGIARDITARKEAEEALALSESRLRTTLYSIGDAVIATDADGRVAIMNAVAEQLTGWSEAEAQGRALEEVFVIVNEESRAAVENPVQRVLREGIVTGLANHTLLIARDGREYPIADAGAPIRDAAGNIAGVVLVFRDQSAERAAQRAVEEARQFAEAIVATVREPLLVLDADLRVVSANRAFFQTFQVTSEETLGRFVYELSNGQWNIPELRQLLEKILPQNSHFDDYEVRHHFEHIGERIMLLNARRLHHDETKTNLILLAIEDATERKQAELKLRQSEEQSRQMAEEWQATFDASSDAIWLLDLQQRVTRANRAAGEMFRCPLQKIVGAQCFTFVHGTSEPIPECPCRRLRQSLQRESIEMQMDNRWFHVTVDPVLDADNRLAGIVHTARDITAQKEAEARLKEQLDELQRWHAATVGRESRVLELKHEVNELLRRLGEPSRYPSVEEGS